MNNPFRVHLPDSKRYYGGNSGDKALIRFLDSPLNGGMAILEHFGDALATRYDDGTIWVYGKYAKAEFMDMAEKAGRKVIIQSKNTENRQVVYFVKVLVGREPVAS